MKYTKASLNKINKMYKRNFQKLIKSVGKPIHKKYAKIEWRLNALEKRVRKALGISISDPCPLTHKSVYCPECIGWFVKEPRIINGKVRNHIVQSMKGRGHKCAIKKI